MYNNENEYSGTSFEYNNGFAPGNNGFAFAALILGQADAQPNQPPHQL